MKYAANCLLPIIHDYGTRDYGGLDVGGFLSSSFLFNINVNTIWFYSASNRSLIVPVDVVYVAAVCMVVL